MVCLAVHTLGMRPVECNARSLLIKGSVALEQCQFVEAGCCLREAVRLYLLAECEYHDCTPKSKRPPCPRVLASALRKAKVLEASEHRLILEFVEAGNSAAHLKFVKPSDLASGFNIMCMILEDARHLVQPKAGGRV